MANSDLKKISRNKSKKSPTTWLLVFISVFFTYAVYADRCHPLLSNHQDNYTIGYGSLMNAESRSITNPEARILIPVKVKGFTRAWNAASEYYKIIFLGAIPCKKDEFCFLNGLVYLNSDVAATDKRERIYCRHEVPFNQIQTYNKKTTLDLKARYWIYTLMPTHASRPSKKHPIMQSYVDVFMSGCIEQAAQLADKKIDGLIYPKDYAFVSDCIHGTQGWTTTYWLNDRVYPQRPWIMSPYALTIDTILSDSNRRGDIQGKYAYRNIPLE